MANEFRIESRSWEPQDLIDDLQLMIDEEPDNYLNGNRTTLCMAKDYLQKFFAAESLRPKGRWENNEYGFQCSECKCDALYDGWNHPVKSKRCPNCGAKMEG